MLGVARADDGLVFSSSLDAASYDLDVPAVSVRHCRAVGSSEVCEEVASHVVIHVALTANGLFSEQKGTSRMRTAPNLSLYSSKSTAYMTDAAYSLEIEGVPVPFDAQTSWTALLKNLTLTGTAN